MRLRARARGRLWLVEGPTATGPSCWCGRGGAHGAWADAWLGRVQACGAVGCAPRVRGHFLAAGDNLVRPGVFDAVGDGNPVPERADCPRLERTAPGRVECPPPASETRSPQAAAEARDPRQSRRPPARNCQESGLMTWDASGPHPRKSLKSDKPDLSLVHLTGVQGSGILCGNRSTSYGRRRIPDRSGRPSVAVHQSNRQGRSRAPSSGQVRDDVPRGDQGAPGR